MRPDAPSRPRGRAPCARRYGSLVRVSGRHEDEVVAVDDLVAALVAEERLDVARVRALDLLDLERRVVDEPAGELASVRTDAADAVPDPEASLDGAHAGGKEAPAALRERALRTGVEVDRAGRLQGVGDPVLATPERVALRDEQGAALPCGVEHGGEDAVPRAVGDRRRDAGGG